MKNIYKILNGVYENKELRKTIVPLFISNPGYGKTKIIEQFAQEKGVNLVEIITSQVSPFEVSGICIPSHQKEKMVYYDFDRIDNLKDNDILFFDELLAGNPSVLAACLTLIESRRTISGKPLPNIMIIAAANPQGQSPLTPAIKERFVWYPIKFDALMWKKYMIDKYGITSSIGTKLSKLIEEESFTGDNFHTPRSIDKAVNMIINEVPTPYEAVLTPIVSELITNSFDKPIVLNKERNLEPSESMPWIELIKLKRNVIEWV